MDAKICYRELRHENILIRVLRLWEPDSVVGIATVYGLKGPGIESRWGQMFLTYPDWLQGPTNLLYNGYRVFPGGKDGRGVILPHTPF
jgi:hypothetical protein